MAFKLAELFTQLTVRDQSFTLGLAKAHKGLLGLRAVADATGLGMLGVFGAAGVVAAALGYSAKATMDLEEKFLALAKATDLDPSGMAALKKQLRDLSTTLAGVSLDDLIGIATTGAKMGVAAGDLAEYTEGIAKVSAAMDDIPAEQIADQVGKVNVVFKLGVKGAMQIGSAIDKLADSGVSSASGILDVTQRLSGVAVTAKLTAAETTALAAALLDTGTQAELGATSLARLIQALNDTKAQKGFARVLGEDAKKFAARVKTGPMAAIQSFLVALKKLDAGSQAAVLKGIGFEGVQGIGEIQKLAQQVDNLKDYAAKAKHEFETLDQVNKSYAASSGSLKAQLTQVGNQLLILADKVGSALAPAIRVGMDAITGVISAIGTYVDNLVIGWGRLFDRFHQVPGIVDSAFGEGTVGKIRALATEGIAYVSDALELYGMYIRNFPDFFDVMVLYGTQAFMNLGETIAVLPANLAIIGDYIKNNWSKLVVDGVNLAVSAFRNLSTNLAELGRAILAFMKDPSKGFRFDWTDLTKGFEASADKLPELMRPRLTSLQDQIDEKLRGIGEREAKATQGANLPKEPTKVPQAGGGEETLDAAGKKKKGQVQDLASFAQSLQEAVSGKGQLAERTAKAAERTAKAAERTAKAVEKPRADGVAMGPAWQAAGLA